MSWDPIDNHQKRFPTEQQLRAQPQPAATRTVTLCVAVAFIVLMLVGAVVRPQ